MQKSPSMTDSRVNCVYIQFIRKFRYYKQLESKNSDHAAFFSTCSAAAGGRGRSHAPSAGNSSIAPSMFTRNMKVSIRPTSAWNLSGENTQVATPIASVTPVKKMPRR